LKAPFGHRIPTHAEPGGKADMKALCSGDNFEAGMGLVLCHSFTSQAQ
jgi:hypothetical protein